MTKLITFIGAAAAAALLSVAPAAAAKLENAAPAGGVRSEAAPGDRGAAIMSAVVAANGTLARGEGVTGIVRNGNPGSYQVRFGRDVTACTYVASMGLSTQSGVAETGFAGTSGDSGDATGVFVKTRNQAGTDTDLPFVLIVYCGR